MCVVSMIGTEFEKHQRPYVIPDTHPQPFDNTTTPTPPFKIEPSIDEQVRRGIEKLSALEHASLLDEVKLLKKLLAAAIEYDIRTGQPDCEVEEKVAFLKAVAKALDYDLSNLGGEFAD